MMRYIQEKIKEYVSLYKNSRNYVLNYLKQKPLKKQINTNANSNLNANSIATNTNRINAL